MAKNTTTYLYWKNVNKQAYKPSGYHQGPHDTMPLHQFCHGWNFHFHKRSKDFLICFQTQHFWTIIIFREKAKEN